MNRGVICTVLVLVCLILGLTSVVLAQDYIYATGNPTFGVSIPIENGFINVANGQVHLEFPLATHSQRGSLKLNERLVYDSRIWKIVQNGSDYSWQPANVANSQSGWRFTNGLEAGSVTHSTTSGNYSWCSTTGSQRARSQEFAHFTWKDSAGTAHVFPMSTSKPIRFWCPDLDPIDSGGQPDDTGYAIDASGYYGQVSNYTSLAVFDPEGNQVYPVQKDRNGNYFSQDANGNLVDTLGRTPVIVTANGNETYFDVLSVGGGRIRYTVTWGTVYVSTSFNQEAVAEYSGSVSAIQRIQQPDGTSYTFTYEPGYGGVQSIALPTGGTVQVTYQNFLDSYNNQNRWIASYAGGNGTLNFQPRTISQCSGGSVGCREQMGVTHADGSFISYDLTLNNGAWNTATYYQDQSGTLLTTTTDYDFSNTCGSYCTGAKWINKTTQTTSLGNSGLKTKTVYSYDNPALGKPTSVKFWDFYVTTPPTSPSREVTYTYGYLANGGASLLTQQVIKDGSGTPVTQTIYNYDETAATPIGGVVQHSAPAGAPGNLTSAAAGTDVSVTTRATYDDTGNKLTAIDGNGNAVEYAYECANTYISTVTYPVTVNGSKLANGTTHDCDTGAVLSTTDLNANTTTFGYDTIGRPEHANYPDGGSSTYSYPSATETDVTVAQKADVTVVSKSIHDSFGRASQELTVAPEGAISSETTYDANGRVHCVTNAHTSTPSSTDGSTCYAYDGIGRPKTQTQPDQNTIGISYAGNTRTVTDELGHQRQYTTDAFGRLTSVVEPDSSGQLTYVTDYQYNGLDLLTRIDQWGGPRNSSGDRYRTSTYNSLGQLTNQYEPESGTTTFTYDGNGNVLTNTNGIGTVTFTYDLLNRLMTQVGSGPNAFSYQYKYDGTDGGTHANPRGNLTWSSNNVNASSGYSYNALGRLLQQTYCLPAICPSQNPPTVTAEYDWAGNLTSLTYPDGRKLKQQFDAANRLSSVNYWSWNGNAIAGTPAYITIGSYAPTGQVTNTTLGDGTQVSSTFGNRGTVGTLKYLKNATPFWNKEYTWDKNAANLVKIRDLTDDTYTFQFAYDQLNRVVNASRAGQVLSQPAQASTATVTITGSEQSKIQQDCEYIGSRPKCTSTTLYDAGTLGITINGHLTSTTYGRYSTPVLLATALASAINADAAASVNATSSNANVTLTSRTTGAGSNYSFAKNITWQMGDFVSPSFSISPTSGNLVGGTNAVYTGAGAVAENYTYDPWGNLTQSGNWSFPATFDTANRITGVNYDAAGNAQADTFGNTYTFNASGLVGTVSEANTYGGPKATYIYDADGNRVEKSGSTTTDYLYFGGQLVATLKSGAWTDFLYAGGMPIGTVAGMENAVPVFRVSDHLGSAVGAPKGCDGVSSSSGIWEFAPYGQPLNGTPCDSFQFTGLERDAESWTDHTPLRQYVYRQGRWLTPDPYGGSYDLSNPQTFNRYAYVAGNPLGAVDPSGAFMVTTGAQVGGSVCGPLCAGIGAAAGIVADLFFGGVFDSGPKFHGSVKPRPDMRDIGNFPEGESLGMPTGMRFPTPTIWQTLGIIPMASGCEFGACGSSFFQNTPVHGPWQYGNWCGAGGMGTPINAVDAVCMAHDLNFAKTGADWTNMQSDSNWNKLRPDQQKQVQQYNQQLCDGVAKASIPRWNVSERTAAWEIGVFFHSKVPKGARCQ